MSEFQLKNYLKFMFKFINENKFTMTCRSGDIQYVFTVTSNGVSLKYNDIFMMDWNIDKISFPSNEFIVEYISLERYQNGELLEEQKISNPALVKIYYTLMTVMGKRAGFLLIDENNNQYKGCFISGKVLYIEEDSENVVFNITSLANLNHTILCVTEVPGYTSFKSFIAETEKYAKCTNRCFIKNSIKEQ